MIKRINKSHTLYLCIRIKLTNHEFTRKSTQEICIRAETAVSSQLHYPLMAKSPNSQGAVMGTLYGELSAGTRSAGRHKLRFKDQCKTSMIEFSINVANWDMVAQDRVGWGAADIMGAKSSEENRVQPAVENRQRRKCPTVEDSTVFYYCRLVCWLVGCFTSQQHASVSQGRICSILRAATLR